MQFVLILRLIRIQYWRNRPVFCSFILYDFLRSLFAAVCKFYWGSNGYFYSFAWTEPLDAALLAGAGLEAGWITYSPVVYLSALLTALPVSLYLPPPNYHPTGKYGWLLVALFVFRSHLMAGTVFATSFTAAFYRRITAHSAILGAFCAIDLTLYLALMFDAPQDPVEALGLLGQCCCLAGWLALSFRTLRIAA